MASLRLERNRGFINWVLAFSVGPVGIEPTTFGLKVRAVSCPFVSLDARKRGRVRISARVRVSSCPLVARRFRDCVTIV